MRVLVLGWLLAGGVALAQCKTDNECPPGGVCREGTCQLTGADATEQPAVIAPSEPVERGAAFLGERAVRPHWAGGAAALGFSVTGPVVAAGIFAMGFFIVGNEAAGIPFALGTMALVGGLGPVVALGAASARFDDSMEGSPGARIFGWVTYGLSLGSGLVALVSSAVFQTDIAFFAAFSMLIFGGTALLLFGVDAVVSGARANAVNAANEAKRAARGVRLAPLAAVVPGSRGDWSGVLGLSGAF